MGVFLDSPPYAGQTFSPLTPQDIATVEAAIVAQLTQAVGNLVEVTHFPDKPEAYEMRHRVGVAMVIYMGSEYAEIRDIGNVVQERTMEFAVGLRVRDLGWAFGGPTSATSPGAYQVLERIRLALTGFQPNTGCTKMMPKRERFVDRDKQGGVWVYEIIFITRTMAVENFQAPAFPLFLEGRALEQAGQTDLTVDVALLTFSGAAPGSIQLSNQNIRNLVVKSSDLATTYELGVDYSLDNVNGLITRIAAGAIPLNATVAIGYAHADVVTALANGGDVPFAPNN